MLKKSVFAVAAMCTVASVYAAPEISVSSIPELPGKNLIGESTFARGVLGSWSMNNKSFSDLISVDKNSGWGDNTALKITGDPARSPNVYHRLRMQMPFKAGEPYYIRYYSKRSGAAPTMRNGGSLAFMPVGGGKYRYAQVPEHVAGDCDWAEYEYNDVIPVDSQYGTFYFCFYKQQGFALYDNVEFRTGWAELDIAVKGGGLQQIVVRNSVVGTVLKERIKGSEYSKKVKVPTFGSNSVEVLDRTGEVTGKLYPANIDANVAASDTVVPLTPVKRVIIEARKSDSFTFALPAFTGKKVYLAFKGRLQRKSGPAGYTNALKVKVNGKSLGLAQVVKPGKVIALKNNPAKKVNIANNNGYVLFYSNTFAAIPAHNNYCPVSFESHDPFDFKLDITKQVEEGLNVIDLQAGSFRKSAIWLDNLRVVIE